MTRPTFLGYSTQQMAKIAQEAVQDAVVADATAGISLTGMVDGRVQSLAPTDPRILAVLAKAQHRSSAGGEVERL